MCRLFFVLTLLLAYIKSYAQFFTISGDSSLKKSLVSKELAEESFISDKTTIPDTFTVFEDTLNSAKRERVLFPETIGHEISIEKNVPVFVSMRNNPLLELIQKRTTVCLPLDYL